jgi:hypothetical protein
MICSWQSNDVNAAHIATPLFPLLDFGTKTLCSPRNFIYRTFTSQITKRDSCPCTGLSIRRRVARIESELPHAFVHTTRNSQPEDCVIATTRSRWPSLETFAGFLQFHRRNSRWWHRGRCTLLKCFQSRSMSVISRNPLCKSTGTFFWRDRFVY